MAHAPTGPPNSNEGSGCGLGAGGAGLGELDRAAEERRARAAISRVTVQMCRGEVLPGYRWSCVPAAATRRRCVSPVAPEAHRGQARARSPSAPCTRGGACICMLLVGGAGPGALFVDSGDDRMWNDLSALMHREFRGGRAGDQHTDGRTTTTLQMATMLLWPGRAAAAPPGGARS